MAQWVITLCLSLSTLAVVRADRNNRRSAVVSNVPAQPCLSPSTAAGDRSHKEPCSCFTDRSETVQDCGMEELVHLCLNLPAVVALGHSDSKVLGVGGDFG